MRQNYNPARRLEFLSRQIDMDFVYRMYEVLNKDINKYKEVKQTNGLRTRIQKTK